MTCRRVAYVRPEPAPRPDMQKERPLTIFAGKYHRETYSQHELESIFERYSVTPSQQAELVVGLEDCAAIWRFKRALLTPDISPAKTAASLMKVAKQAEALKAALAQLHDDAKQRLGSEMEDAQTTAFMMGKASILDLPEQVADFAPLIDVEDTERLLSCLQNSAIELAAARPKGKNGAKPDHALRMWMTNIAMIWEDTLGRRFTRDIDRKGAPVSEAARFCVEAFAHVSPETPSSRVLHSMKLHIARQRQKATGKIRPKTGA